VKNQMMMNQKYMKNQIYFNINYFYLIKKLKKECIYKYIEIYL
jgi:hypothetical protein